MPLALIKHPWNSHAKLTAAFAKELLLQPPSMWFWKSLPAFCEAQVCRILIKISSWEKVSEFGRKKPGIFLKGYLRGFTNKKIWWLLRKRTNSARFPISLATGSYSGGAVLGIRALCAQQERLWVPQARLVEHHELPLGKIQSGGYVSSWQQSLQVDDQRMGSWVICADWSWVPGVPGGFATSWLHQILALLFMESGLPVSNIWLSDPPGQHHTKLKYLKDNLMLGKGHRDMCCVAVSWVWWRGVSTAPGAWELGTALSFTLLSCSWSLSLSFPNMHIPSILKFQPQKLRESPLGNTHSAPPLHWADGLAQVYVQIACPPIDTRLII